MGHIFKSIELLNEEVESLRKQGKTIVAVNGCFDAFHKGHDYFLTNAKKQGDILIVLINTDEYIRSHKGESRPLNDEQRRLSDVDSHDAVDMVCIFHEEAPLKAFALLKPDIYCVAQEYWPDPIEKDTITKYGGKLHMIPRLSYHSTTDILMEKGLISEKTHGPKSKDCPKQG